VSDNDENELRQETRSLVGQIRTNLALALSLSGSRAQLLALLDTVPDPARRKEIAAFSANWAPGWTGDTGIKGTAP